MIPTETNPPLAPVPAQGEPPPAPDAAQPGAAGDAARPGAWWGVWLVLLVLLGVAGGIIAIWLPVAAPPAGDLERYYPLANGLSLSYRLTHPDGRVTFQSENYERLQGNNAASQLDLTTLGQLAGLGVNLEDVQHVDLTLARVTTTDYDPGGAITRTTNLLALRPEGLRILSLGQLSFDPPLPFLDIPLAVREPRLITGSINSATPFTATLAMEAQEALDTPVGRLDDCWRVRFGFLAGSYEASSLSWFCAGVGVARQENSDNSRPGEVSRLELIGLSAPGRVAGVEPPPALTQTGLVELRGPGRSGAWSQPISGTLELLWSYRDRGANSHITTPALPVDAPEAGLELLLYGSQNGGLIALDRASHTPKWRFQTGDAIYGAPVVAGGLVYVGSNDRRLYALDLASGALRWAFLARDAISASPAVANGLVYVGSEDRTIYALDALTGQERWRYSTGDAVAAPPTVVDGVVYIGSDDGALYALDGASGTLRWAFAAEDAITAGPTVSGGVVYVGSYDHTLYALRAATAQPEGELLWRYDAEAPLVTDLAVAGGLVYLVTYDNDVRAVEIESGAERWRYHSNRNVYGAPILVGERLWLNRQTEALALDSLSGAERELIPTGEPPSYTGLSSDGRYLYMSRRIGFLQVLGPGGEQPWVATPRWEAAAMAADLRLTPDTLSTPPVRSGDRLIYVSTFGGLYSVGLADGSYETLGQLDFGPVLIPPALAGDNLYLIDVQGFVLVFDLAERRARWQAETAGRSWSAASPDGERTLLAVAQADGVTAYAFETATGQIIWQQAVEPSPIGASASLLHAGRFYFTAGALHVLDAASGRPLWRSGEPLIPTQIIVLDDWIYTVGQDEAGWALAAWELATGEAKVMAPLELPTFPNLLGSLAGQGGRLALLLQDGTLLAFDAASGAELWRQAAVGEPAGPPVIYQGAVLLQTRDNHLIARSLDDGHLLGDFTLASDTGRQDYSAAAPLLIDGELYAAFYQTPFVLQMKE